MPRGEPVSILRHDFGDHLRLTRRNLRALYALYALRLDDAVSAQHEEPAGTVHVERMVHGMVPGHFVEQPDLDLVTDPKTPVDRGVLGVRVTVDQLPAHIRRRRHP